MRRAGLSASAELLVQVGAIANVKTNATAVTMLHFLDLSRASLLIIPEISSVTMTLRMLLTASDVKWSFTNRPATCPILSRKRQRRQIVRWRFHQRACNHLVRAAAPSIMQEEEDFA